MRCYPIAVITLFVTLSTAFAQEEAPDALAKYNQGRYEEAIAICIDELTVMPRRMDAYAVLGWSLLKLQRWEEALDYSLKAMEISRNDPRIVEILAEVYYNLGKNLEALAYFQEYTILSPTGSRIEDVYYYMGEIFIRLGEFNHADISFSTAVYHSPNRSQWWSRLGYAREMAEDFSHALDAYEKALKLNPASSEAVRGKARVLEKMETG